MDSGPRIVQERDGITLQALGLVYAPRTPAFPEPMCSELPSSHLCSYSDMVVEIAFRSDERSLTPLSLGMLVVTMALVRPRAMLVLAVWVSNGGLPWATLPAVQ